ncbi:MAG: sugar-binding domain-containing protein, partial [bacterium]
MRHGRLTLLLLAGCLLAAGCRGTGTPAPASAASRPRERILLAEGWRFAATDESVAAEARTFDDSVWPTVQVPHTWGAGHQRAGWYRLRFRIAPEDLGGRRVYVCFDGVSVYADFYVNGQHLGQHRGGFTRFTFDATPHLVEGENVLAVRASNDPA